MDKELDKYYMEQFTMMSSQGWHDLMDDLKKIEDDLGNVRTVKDEQTLNYRLGQLDILDLILNRKKTCEQVYEELQNG